MQQTPGHVEFVHRSWPADSEQLAVIRRELSDWLEPIPSEAGLHVRHAYGPDETGAVELTLWTEPGTLAIEVVDHGSWRAPATDPSRQSGRGIPLMSTMSESVLIHYDERGSRVLLRHRIQDEAEPSITES